MFSTSSSSTSCHTGYIGSSGFVGSFTEIYVSSADPNTSYSSDFRNHSMIPRTRIKAMSVVRLWVRSGMIVIPDPASPTPDTADSPPVDIGGVPQTDGESLQKI